MDDTLDQLTEEQRMMRDSCRAFVETHVAPFIRENWQQEWQMAPEGRLPEAMLKAADEVGIRTLGVPEQYGGFELDPETETRTFSIIAREIARGDSGLADKLVQNWKISVLLRNVASQKLQAEWFPKLMADHKFLMAHCLTEPRGASDRWLPYNVPQANMDTTAELKDGTWVLNGRKHYISNGYDASLYVVYANTNPKVGMLQGTSSFLVPRDTPGLKIVRCNETMGCRFMNNGELEFDACVLPEENLLVKDEALPKAGIYFRPGKIIQAAKNLGVGIAAYERACAFVENHVQGGQILIKHQVVAQRIAQMAIKLQAVQALLDRASLAVDLKSPDADVLCNMVKAYASEEILVAVRHCLELHGGHGAMLETGVEKLFRDAAIFLHMDATVDISHFKIVKSLFPDTAGTYAA